MGTVYRILLIAVLAMLGTQAFAESRRYEMVTAPQIQNNTANEVVILDRWTGELWSWSEPSATVMYIGKVFPIAVAGPFLRLIPGNSEPNSKKRNGRPSKHEQQHIK